MSLSNVPYMYSGESKYLKVTVSDEQGNPVNILNSDFTWTLQYKASPIVKTMVNGDITILDGVNGVVQVELKQDDTKNISGIFKHYLEETDSNGHLSVVLDDYLHIKNR